MKIKLYLPLLLIFVQQSINGMSISNNFLLHTVHAIKDNSLNKIDTALLQAIFSAAEIKSISQLTSIYSTGSALYTELLKAIQLDLQAYKNNSTSNNTITLLYNNFLYYNAAGVRVNQAGVAINAWGIVEES